LASTTFTDFTTPVVAAWLNDVNLVAYTTVPANTAAIAAETTRAEAAEALLAPKASPTFTGTVVVPTAGAGSTSPIQAAQLSASSGSSLVEFLQSGTGAVAVTVQSKLRESLRVLDFGAYPTRVTDSTAAFNAAQVAATAAHTSVFIPGTTAFYLIAGTITVTTSMTGVGTYSVLRASSATADVIQISATTTNTCVLSNFRIDSTAADVRTGGYFINNLGAAYVDLINLRLFSYWNGIALTGAATTRFHILNCYLTTAARSNNRPGGYGITVQNSSAGGGVDIEITDTNIDGTVSTTSHTTAAIYLVTVGGCAISNCNIQLAGIALLVAPDAGHRIQALFIDNSYFDSGTGHGISLSPVSTGIINLVKITSCWCATNTGSGIMVGENATGQVQRVEIINCTCSNNTVNGITLNGATVTNTSIIGGSMSHNVNGISVADATGRFSISGVKAGAAGEFATNTSYGLSLNGTLASFMVMNNDFSLNTSGAILAATYTGTEGTNYFLRDNLLV